MQSRQAADILLGITSKMRTYLIKPDKIGNFISEKDIVGTYQTADEFTFRFEMRDSVLFLIRFGRNDTKLVRESANIFHQWNDPPFKQEFKVNEKNEMEVTAYYTSHAPYTLTRQNSNWNGFNFQSFSGKYYNEETGVYFSVHYQSDKTYVLKMGNQERTAILISPKKLLSDNYSIEFGNTNDELLLNGDRIKRVKFKRVK